MAVAARIIGYSLLTAGLGAWLGYALFSPSREWIGLSFVLACVGAIVGTVAGATGEIVTAQRWLAEPKPWESKWKSYEPEV
jgi:hypothetical protein